MRHHRLGLWTVSILLLFPPSAFSQQSPPESVARDLIVSRISFLGDFSAIGSDGNFYRVRHNFGQLFLPASLDAPVRPAVVPDPPSSTLEVFDLNPNSTKPVDSISFSGVASQLDIGKDNRLFLIVNVTPPISIARDGNPGFVPVPAPKSRLYIIPTPFPPRVLGATLESLAHEAGSEVAGQSVGAEGEKLDGIVQADFDGAVHSLQVKQVGDQEYLYLSASIPSYRFPTLNGNSDGVAPVIAPVTTVTKLIIFNNNGRKIKEADSE